MKKLKNHRVKIVWDYWGSEDLEEGTNKALKQLNKDDFNIISVVPYAGYNGNGVMITYDKGEVDDKENEWIS